MLNIEECFDCELIPEPSLIVFYYLLKEGVVQFDLTQSNHLAWVARISVAIKAFLEADVSELSEKDRMKHEQKQKLLLMIAELLFKTTITSDTLKFVS